MFRGISEELQQERIAEQMQFIEDALKEAVSQATDEYGYELPLWTLVMGHYPIYSSGWWNKSLLHDLHMLVMIFTMF